MIRLDCRQGSDEWRAARLGIPTASQFHRLLTPVGLKASASAARYRYELLAERLIGEPQDMAASDFMERGKGMEPEAISYYEMVTGVEVDRVGICLLDDGSAGCSPDGLVGEDGGLEIKCLSAVEHVAALLGEGGHRARCQVQGGLHVTGREWWDLLLYSPTLPPVLTRMRPDEEWLGAFVPVLAEFTERLALDLAVLEERLEMEAPRKGEPPSVGELVEQIFGERGAGD